MDPQTEWSMTDVVRATGTTSRTLRHYDRTGLLPPSRTGANGYRYYDQDALVTLQRILVLRELGLGLPAIADVLRDTGRTRTVEALREHLAQLEQERTRLVRITRSVRRTVERLERGEPLMATETFDGFDHTQYREEVERRWGTEAYARSDQWWRSLGEEGRRTFQQEHADIVAGYAAASASGKPVDSEEVQELARRHAAWVGAGWSGTRPSAEAFAGLGQMYVDDPRFAVTYEEDGRSFVTYVRDAMALYADRELD